MSQYIGKTISLVSNSNIRYVGVLHEINSEQSTVSLKQVRSYGTEGRRQGVDEIPPSDGVYEFIIFRGSDVKDLKIAENAPPPVNNFQDPAIIQSQAPPPPPPSNIPTPQNYAYPTNQEAPPPVEHQQPQNHYNQRPHHNNNRGGKKFHNNNRGPTVPQSEFDFAESNAKFTKDESVIPPNPDSSDGGNHDAFYNKTSSFFDNISSTAKERAEGDNDNMTPYERRGEERKLNMETFGQPAAHRGRGRGRGGNRGHYYRGRGGNNRGRGGFNYYNNNNSN